MKCHKMNMCILYHAYCNKPALCTTSVQTSVIVYEENVPGTWKTK